ncbi:DUF2529 family protein [Psychrobacillus sp. NEAU-3TGS]|uniref:DUF2529 family protein n=1 Tax=Psychrobacillus sp. NEAU-3TGS TaxID=2995412 RepID=UPI002495D1A5|nr:DUF2529 family protein [Psychrobacillus sp. NEAU-3TGS]MDI2587773.1 DUF2529 family protein [Psychrobacillus sp. NEAU-3TGS]
MKMLTTQLTGLFQRLATSEEENIEETARLLAQAAAREGNIYFATFGEMASIAVNAQFAAEPFPSMKTWTPTVQLTSADRVWIITRSSENEEVIELAEHLSEEFIPFSVLAAEPASEENKLADLAYTYISMKLTKGLLPAEDGSRIVLPYALAAMFVYEAVKMKLDEMLLGE